MTAKEARVKADKAFKEQEMSPIYKRIEDNLTEGWVEFETLTQFQQIELKDNGYTVTQDDMDDDWYISGWAS